VKGGTHFAIGAAAGWLALWGAQSANVTGAPAEPGALLAGALVAAVGAIVPDIDHRRSTVSRRVPRRLVAEALRIIVPMAILVVAVAAVGGEDRAGAVLSFGMPLLKLVGLLVLPAAILVAVSLLVSRVFGHRGATHSLVFAAGATLVATALCARFDVTWWYGALFGLGWLSHLAADATSRKGLPSLWWPIAGRK
jgi:membrane-bound metal-dependent hydrolase YbcI (DUF457 family)